MSYCELGVWVGGWVGGLVGGWVGGVRTWERTSREETVQSCPCFWVGWVGGWVDDKEEERVDE